MGIRRSVTVQDPLKSEIKCSVLESAGCQNNLGTSDCKHLLRYDYRRSSTKSCVVCHKSSPARIFNFRSAWIMGRIAGNRTEDAEYCFRYRRKDSTEEGEAANRVCRAQQRGRAGAASIEARAVAGSSGNLRPHAASYRGARKRAAGTRQSLMASWAAINDPGKRGTLARGQPGRS